jgi:hypothetical protein
VAGTGAAGAVVAGAGAVVAGAGAAGAVVAAIATAAQAKRPPGAVPDVKLDTVIHTDQLELVSRDQNAAVAAADRRATQDAATLARELAAQSHDEHLASDAGAVRAAATRTVDLDTTALGAAVTAHRRAVAATDLERRRLQALAVGWYTGGAAVDPSGPGTLASSESAADAADELGLLTTITARHLSADDVRGRRTATAQAAASAALGRARAVLAADKAEADDAAAVLAAAADVVASGRARASAAETALGTSEKIRDQVVAAFDGSEGAGRHPVPSILGPSALTAAQLVRWYDSMGYVVATKATIGQLATLYISEGRAEGVRGDIAFAQSVVETGEFDSPDAVHRSNYAGIGHCDTCRSGLRFASPLDGVRTQIQLLRTDADPTLTTADLPSPPPIAALAPEYQTTRGCCRTWNALTGVWASDPQYGRTVLEVYTEILAYTVAQQASSSST